MAVSDAQKKSAQKWDAANLDRVSIAMPKGTKDKIKAAAESVGESMNQYINGAINRRITGNPCKTAQKPTGASESSGDILTPSALKKAQEAAQSAGETVSVFVERAVETQASRDKAAFALKRAERKTLEEEKL